MVLLILRKRYSLRQTFNEMKLWSFITISAGASVVVVWLYCLHYCLPILTMLISSFRRAMGHGNWKQGQTYWFHLFVVVKYIPKPILNYGFPVPLAWHKHRIQRNGTDFQMQAQAFEHPVHKSNHQCFCHRCRRHEYSKWHSIVEIGRAHVWTPVTS